MLKFTNTEKTCATFNGVFLTLAAPEDWESIGDGPTREAVMTWLAVGNMPETVGAPPEPSPIEVIRAIEQSKPVADAMQRATRLVALSYAIDDLIRVSASKGQTVTRDQAHNWAMLNDSNYKTLYDAEQVIKPLRALV